MSNAETVRCSSKQSWKVAACPGWKLPNALNTDVLRQQLKKDGAFPEEYRP